MITRFSNIRAAFFAALFIGIIGLFLQGCLAQDRTSPQKQLITIYDQYNTQYADYMVSTGFRKEDGAWVKRFEPELSEERKEILRKKKKILTQIYPMIKVYDNLVNTGGDIPPDLMPEIIDLLNKLAVL